MTNRIAVSLRRGTALMAFTVAATVMLIVGNAANATIVTTVGLGTSSNYSVLGGQTVTNTGGSVLNKSLGLFPGTSVTGFPPGTVVPPGTIDVNNSAAQQAKSDLTAAYLNAAGRPLNATTTADLGNLNLQGGVYAGPSKSPLSITGPLILDGAGNTDSVFIFQTDSTLITASGSTVTLINGAQECNVFWQVGSSATLGTGSVFVGNILALTSITVNTGVTVRGRALARNAAVTLDTDTFTTPTCATSSSTTTTAAGSGGSSSGGAADSGSGGGTDTALGLTSGGRPGTPRSGSPGIPGVNSPPATGGAPLRTQSFPWFPVLFSAMLGGVGITGAILSRRFYIRAHPSAKH